LGLTRPDLKNPGLLEAVAERLAAGPDEHSATNRVL
jgi:hypothetical protein